jgi:hypothetical protein
MTYKIPKHGEARGPDRWDNPSKAWVRSDEWQQRQWAREDAVFARQANQGELCAPQGIISDTCGKTINGVQSQTDGRWYDSKSQLRREYKRADVIEVGSEVVKTRFWHGDKPRPDPVAEKHKEAALDRAFNRAGIPPV